MAACFGRLADPWEILPTGTRTGAFLALGAGEPGAFALDEACNRGDARAGWPDADAPGMAMPSFVRVASAGDKQTG